MYWAGHIRSVMLSGYIDDKTSCCAMKLDYTGSMKRCAYVKAVLDSRAKEQVKKCIQEQDLGCVETQSGPRDGTCSQAVVVKQELSRCTSPTDMSPGCFTAVHVSSIAFVHFDSNVSLRPLYWAPSGFNLNVSAVP
jgi:hypothetical protein